MFMPFMEVILHTVCEDLRIKLKDLDQIKQSGIPVKTNNTITVVPSDYSLADVYVLSSRNNILRKLKLIKNIGKYCLPSIFMIFSITFISIGVYLKQVL